MPQEPVIAPKIGLVQTVKTDEVTTDTQTTQPQLKATDTRFNAAVLPEGSLDPGRAVDQKTSSTLQIPGTSPFFGAVNAKGRTSTTRGDELMDNDLDPSNTGDGVKGKGDHASRTQVGDKIEAKAGWLSDSRSAHERQQALEAGLRGHRAGDRRVTRRALPRLDRMGLDQRGRALRQTQDRPTRDPRRAPGHPLRPVHGRGTSLERRDDQREWAGVRHSRFPLDDFDPRALPVADLIYKLNDARIAAKDAAEGSPLKFKEKVLERELNSRQVCVTVTVEKPSHGGDERDVVYVALSNRGRKGETPRVSLGRGETQKFFAAFAEFTPKVPLDGPLSIRVLSEILGFDDPVFSGDWGANGLVESPTTPTASTRSA